MRLTKRALAVFLAAALTFPLGGCWDYREVESLSVVSGIAIDRGENGARYHLTVECLNQSAAAGQNGSSAQTALIETDGGTVFDAVRNALQRTDKKLYFSDCKIVIISEAIARDGIRPVMDWLLRDSEPRISTYLLVSQENTASQVLRQPASPGDIPSFKIAGMLDGASQYDAACMPMRLYQIANLMKTEGQALSLPGIRVVGDPKKPALQIGETAVFGDDKMVGWLPREQSKYFLFLMNKVGGGLIVAQDPKDGDSYTLEILKSETNVKPQVQNGRVTMKINIATEAALGEAGGTQTGEYADDFKTVERAAEKTILTGVENVITGAQNDYGTDFIGFGKKLQQDSFADWKKIKGGWNSGFKNVRSEITVKVSIKNSAVELTKGSE